MSADHKSRYTQLFPHNLVHKKSVYNQNKCTACKENTVNIILTSNCKGCTEGYRHTFKERLNQGWGIAITAAPGNKEPPNV